MIPVHVAYGGAHLFNAKAATKWRDLARTAFDAHVVDAATLVRWFGVHEDRADPVYHRARAQLQQHTALASLRIDFEDGYGVRPHEEEDAAATAAAHGLAAMVDRPALLGIRPKSFAPATRQRAIRTLHGFFGALGPHVPEGFVVTLPKVGAAHDVAVAVGALAGLEERFGLAPLGIELMAETPAFFDAIAHGGLARFHDAAEGRLRSIHFGAYDLLSGLGIPGHEQRLDHSFCKSSRAALAQAAMPLGISLYDGATLTMPVAPHRQATLTEEQTRQNVEAVGRAMRDHSRNVRDALALGWAGSWDLHPAQLVARHVATIDYFLGALPEAKKRLTAFLQNAARATRAGQTFDDAASARGLLRFVVSGLEAGALTQADLTGLPVAATELGALSFDELVARLAQLPR